MAIEYGTSGNDHLKGGAEDDILIGRGGHDYLWGDITGTTSDDTLIGGAGNDFLDGGAGDDALYGDEGDDQIYGGAGEDTLHGDVGDDVLDGGAGADELHGGAGDDDIDGGAGDDVIVGFEGDDDIDGGAGQDTLDLSGVAGNPGNFGVTVIENWIHAYSSQSTGTVTGIERFVGTDHMDIVLLDGPAHTFEGGGGDDIWAGGAGSDYFNGGAGVDTASYQHADSGVRVSLNSYNSSGTGDAKGDVLLFVENLHGSSHDDQLTGDSGSNRIRGGSGDDVIRALTGEDVVTGDDGADTFVFHKTYSASHYSSSRTYVDRGVDRVTDYEDGVDAIQLVGYARGEVSIRDAGADAVIDAGQSVDIRVAGAAGQLDMGDLLFG